MTYRLASIPLVMLAWCPLASTAQQTTSAAAGSETSLSEVVISSGKRVGARPVLRDEIVATESLDSREIEKTGATMLTEVLDKRAGISVQTECSICNVRNVVLNNLPGRYTTLLIDGIPIFSSISSAYGLDSVNLGGIERIDISRGAGTSLIAPEALAGSVNIVTRRPTQDEFKAMQQFGSFGQSGTDVFGAKVLPGGAVTANASLNRHDSVDGDGNRISEYTGYARRLGGIGYFVDEFGGFKLKGRLDLVDEKRMGGALGRDYASVKASQSGNPFLWSRGPNGSSTDAGWTAVGADGVAGTGDDSLVTYNDGAGGMSEVIFTQRQQFVTSGTHRLGDGSLRLALGYAAHQQDSYYERTLYNADQTQYYLEASVQQPLGQTLVTAGLNYRYEDLQSQGQSVSSGAVNGIDNYVYRTPGVFLQAYRALLDSAVEVNGSVRLDDHNVFGTIASPRLNVLWNHTHELNSRFAAGRGFRAPTSFFEQDHGILDDAAIIREIRKAEISDNASYALSYAGDRIAWVGSLNYSRIHNMALISPGEDGTAYGHPGQTVSLFRSAQSPVTVAGADITLTYKISPAMEATVAAEHFNYRFSEPGTLTFARPENRAYLRLDYEAGSWTTLARATWTGAMDLARFYNYASTQRYNFDGSRKRDKSPAYWTVDLRGEYRFDKHLSMFLGVDNLTDFKQSDIESMLWVDRDGAIDYTHIWGPGRGRFVYTGLKYTL